PRHPAQGRRDRARGDHRRGSRHRHLAVPRRAARRRPVRGRAGRRPHLRSPDRAAAGVQRGRHDRRLEPRPLRRPRTHLDAHHQRGRRGQPRRPRHHQQAAGNHRVGMTRLALAAPNETSAAAGRAIAEAGGNAMDAAIAAALVLMVNEVGLVSASAGGFITVQTPEGRAMTVDGWMDMPGRDENLLRERRGTGTWDVRNEYGGGVTITVGPGSVATHGALAGFAEAHARWGSMPWAELFGPAIEVARAGFVLSGASRFYLDYVHDVIF